MIADLVAFDRDDRPVLIAEVKLRNLDLDADGQTLGQLAEGMRSFNVAYGMLADLSKIRVFERDAASPQRLELVCEFETGDVLRHYDPEFGESRVFEDYLQALLGTWLRDLAYYWKSETPPGSPQLEAIGLLQRLEDGTTRSEVTLGVDSLR